MHHADTRARVGAGGRVLVLAAVVAGGGAAVLAGQERPTPPGPRRATAATTPQRLEADLTVRHRRLASDGTPLGPDLPAMVVHVDRRRSGARWRTSLTLRSDAPARILALNGAHDLPNPFAIARMEFDDDGAAPRMFDRQGHPVPVPGRAARRFFDRPDRSQAPSPADQLLARLPSAIRPTGGAFEGLVVDRADRDRRARHLETRFGRAVGRVRGLDRYVAPAGEALEEVLVDPETALPAEVNVARGGQLVRRSTFAYAEAAGRRLVRRQALAEQLLPGDRGDRLQSTIALSDVVIDDGRDGDPR
jgi:hypothetical protein